ncbi:alpha/beta hydrolase [Nocardia sp. NPDC056100]|uniref:alpha/beta hydrolase n=1 Tax=Nocardia sp. NPDC056100 TaxID=3345712 RepID=UPI0035D72784
MSVQRRKIGRWVVVSVCAASAALVAVPAGAAAPAEAADGSHIDHVVRTDERRETIYVYSAAMNRVIGLRIIRAADSGRPQPTLYLLNGAEDGVDASGVESSWETNTDLADFMADKNVNTVTVLDGRYTYYTDWIADDPNLGRNKWTTFLTRELPPLLDAELNGSGRNAIVGVSMSGTAALSLAESAPELYRSVGSFSGCAETSTDPGRRYVQAVVLSGGGNPWNMWGVDGAPGWVANDPSTPENLEKLRGIDLHISAGDGGAADPTGRAHTAAGGGALESVVDTCTHELEKRTTQLGIPATYTYVPGGQHSWPYWQDALHQAWPGIERSLTTGN